MELLFQAWDELDDLLAALRYVLSRYATGGAYAFATGARAALARCAGAASHTRAGAPLDLHRTAAGAPRAPLYWCPGQDSNLRPSA